MKEGRTLCIGDVHGAARALEQVLDRANITEKDTIIQLGDVADGWSETPECVDLLLSLPNLISIRGNHDVWCYDWFNHGVSHMIWTKQGGQATIDAYVRTGQLQDPHHRAFWNEQQDWYIDDKNRLFIHAGWAYAEKPLEWNISSITDRKLFELQAGMSLNTHRTSAIGSIAKECHWNRELLEGALSGSVKNKKTGEPSGFNPLKQFEEVYIGHTATRNGLPLNALNLWNLDTGAGWDGKLTIMDIDTKNYWQSDLVKELYPEEKGR